MRTFKQQTAPDVQTAASAFQTLVQASRTASTRPSSERRPGQQRLRLLTSPNRKEPLSHPREIGQVDGKLLGCLQGLASGELDWPLFLHGPPGSGKTSAALALLDHVERGLFYTASAYHKARVDSEFHRLEWRDKENGKSGTWSPRGFLRYVAGVELLVLDDIGAKGNITQAFYDSVLELLNAREYQPMIVTSNIHLKAIELVYDGRVASRLGAGTVFELSGQDRRTL